MKKTLSVYAIAYLVLLMFVIGLQLVYPRLELHLMLNAHHTGILDSFFKYYSMLAEWTLYVFMLLPLFWKKYGTTLFFALSELSAGATLQIMKHIISTDRPVSAFENYHSAILPLVEGVDMHHSNSFPSGHASTFFVFCTCCALLLAYYYQQRQKKETNSHTTWFLVNSAMLALLIFAALGCYSRIYLSQHFLLDVCAGSIIGFIAPCVVFYFGRNKLLKPKKKETK